MKLIQNKILILILSVLAVFSFSGCGSEGIPSNDQLVGGTQPVHFLTIDAGQDKDVASGHNVSLHGVANTDEPNTSLKIMWEQVDGNITVIIDNANTFNPTFVSPHVQVKTLLTFKLQVDGVFGSAEDTVTIRMLPTSLPQVLPPNVITTQGGSTVTVHATVLPPAGGQTLTHTWTQISGPNVTLPTTNQTQITFVAPIVAPGTTSTVILNHTVTNIGTGTSTRTPHTVHVVAPQPPNTPLSAIVSTPLLYETITRALHVSAIGGSGSYTYTWSQKSGISVTIDQLQPQSPLLDLPAVTKNELIELQVVISDGNQTITKIIPLTIRNITLSVSASSNPLSHGSHKTHLHVIPLLVPLEPTLTPLTIHWSEVGGSRATINNADTNNPEIILPAGSATYTFKVEAIDSAGNTATDTTVVTAIDDLHVNAGNDCNAVENTSVSLHGLSTGAFGAETITWTQTAGPSVSITDGNTLNPKIKTPILGTTNSEVATFKMEVTDANNRSTSDTIDVTISPVLPTVSISAPSSLPASATSSASCRTQGGASPFTYLWTASSNEILFTSSSTDANVTIAVDATANAPVVLTCTVSDAQGRSVAATHTISTYQVATLPPASPLSVTISVSNSINENQVSILSAHVQGGSAPYTYQWSSRNYAHGDILNETSQNASFKPPYLLERNGVEEVFVTVTDGNGDSVESAHEVIMIQDIPLTVNIVGATTVLRGQEVHLTATVQGGDGNYQYAWKHLGHNDTFSATSTLIIPASVTKDTATAVVAFILTVKNTVATHTETVTKTVVITVKDNPATITP